MKTGRSALYTPLQNKITTPIFKRWQFNSYLRNKSFLHKNKSNRRVIKTRLVSTKIFRIQAECLTPRCWSFMFPDRISVCCVVLRTHWCVFSICSCCCSGMLALSSPLHTPHTHTSNPASAHWGQRLPSWQRSDSLMAPEMSTQLPCLGKTLYLH